MLEKIFSHSTLVLESNFNYFNFKKELADNSVNFISFDANPEEIDAKKRSLNFKIEDIKDVKDFQNSKSSQNRFIITNRSLRSTVIQNAFLKILEEPTENTFIVIFTKDISMLLATIVSRCQVIKDDIVIGNTKSNTKEKDLNQTIKEKIISGKYMDKKENRFEKLERFLITENLNQKGLISEKQFEEYKNLF